MIKRRAGLGIEIGRVSALCGALLVACCLAGCNALGLQAPQTAFYDFGLIEPARLPPAAAPARIEVTAPSWLNGSSIQYRLAWKQPERRRAYAESRWAAQPADMLAVSLGRALRVGNGGNSVGQMGARCRLKVEIDELIQVFDTEQRNHVELVVRVELLPPRGELPLAGREFRQREAGITADAEGGVKAARAAVLGLAGDIAGWLDALDRQTAQGLNSAGRCGSA
jgi:cholesterol transport system auxiliary component